MLVTDLATNLVPDGTTNLTPFDSTASADVGIFLSDRENVLDVCQRLASSIGAALVTDIAGKFKLVQVITDYAGAADYTVTREDMEQGSLEISEKLDIVGSVKLGYCKNWTVQQSGLAGGLPASSAALFAKEWYIAEATDATVLTNYQQNSAVPQKDTLLLSTATATAEATRLLNIKDTPRFIYTATYFAHMLLVELGEFINITYPRYGLDSGKTGMVVSVDRDWLNGRATIGVLI